MNRFSCDGYWTKLGSAHLTCSKSNVLTQGFGEVKYSIYFRAPSKENRQKVLKSPTLPNDFQARLSKLTNIRCEGHRLHLMCLIHRKRDLRDFWSLGWEDSHGEGNGTPIQYSCLENSVGRGGWLAKVHGATKSWTWLIDPLSTQTCIY